MAICFGYGADDAFRFPVSQIAALRILRTTGLLAPGRDESAGNVFAAVRGKEIVTRPGDARRVFSSIPFEGGNAIPNYV